MNEALMGLDIGTTSTKAVLFDTSGAELSRATSPSYSLQMPQPGWVEQDPEEVWQAAITAIHGAIEQLEPDTQVLAVCIAAQSGSLLPVNLNGDPVYPLITWMDGRTEALVQQWRDDGVQDQVKSVSGWSLYPGLCLPTIAWLRRHDPKTFSNAQRYFSVNDFIAYRLTGQCCTNPSNAGGMQLVDLHTGSWSDSLCALAGISISQLSPINPAGTIIGKISADVCRSTGLSSQAVLINGGHDQGMAALGLGVNSPGKILLACGTAWVVTAVTTSTDIAAAPSALDWNFHPQNGRWTISQSLGGLGASLEWWLNQAWRGVDRNTSRRDMFAALDAELAEAGPDNGLFFLPLTGGHYNPATTQSGGFVGLSLSHTRSNMAWAVLESAAFELHWTLEAIWQAGLPIEQLWMIGGAAESTHWPTILANATGIPISLPQYDNWPALGAALLAGVGVGIFKSVEEGLGHLQKPARSVVPDEAMRAYYADVFGAYKHYRKTIGT